MYFKSENRSVTFPEIFKKKNNYSSFLVCSSQSRKMPQGGTEELLQPLVVFVYSEVEK